MNSAAEPSAAQDGSAKSTAAASASSRRRRRWIFRLAAVLFALLLLPLTEGLLRLLNIGPNVNLVVPVRSTTTDDSSFTHQFNGPADLPFFGQADVAGPEERPFVLPKPAETYRIVVLGASTVIGFPYNASLAFPRQLEWQLKAQNPATDVEVLNAGITSMNSFAVDSLAEQCLQVQPDLVVIHTGHNEFYGPGGPASSAFNLSPAVIRFCYQLRRWRSVQLLTRLTSSQQPLADDLLDVLPEQLQIPLDSAVYRQAQRNYHDNLRRMVQNCRDNSVEILLTTVACNLQDQSPLLAIWPSASSDGREEFGSLIEQSGGLIEDGQFHAALSLLERAEQIVTEHADLCYRKGQCLAGLQKFDEAFRQFSKARDLDGCRFRIPSDFASIPETLATEHQGCRFYDLAADIAAVSENGLPGHDLFLEHVHYNFDGHYQVSRLLAEQIVNGPLQKQWDRSRAVSLPQMKQRLGLIEEDDLAATSFSIQVFQTGPFSRTLDKERHVRFLSQRAARLFQEIPDNRSAVFADLPMDRMSAGLVYFLMEGHRKAGHEDVVRLLQQRLKKRIPWKMF